MFVSCSAMRRFLRHTLGAAFLTGIGCQSAIDPASIDETGANWRAERIDLELHPDFQTQKITIAGVAVLRLDGDLSAGPTLRLGHDIEGLTKSPEFMRFISVDAGQDASVTLNRSEGTPGIVFTDVRFTSAYKHGARVELRFEVESVADSFEFVITDKVAIGAYGTGWYPRPIAATGDIFQSDLDDSAGVTRITMPQGWRSLATGEMVSSQTTGSQFVESWKQNSKKERSFVIGPYAVEERKIGDIDVAVYSLTDALDADAFLPILENAITSLSNRYGDYPYSKYAAAEFPNDAVRWWGDALGDIHVLRTSLVEHCSLFCIAHEIGHAWWGNSVSSEGLGGYTLVEAMAEFSAFLTIEYVEGKDAYQKAIALEELADGMPPDYTMENHFKFIADGKDKPLSQGDDNDGVDYQIAIVKGSRVFHMLRRQMGDDLFFSVLRQFQERHAGGSASLSDLRAAFIKAAPDEHLPQFFEQWLDRTGAPILEASLTCESGANGQFVSHIVLDQKQSGDPYKLDVEIAHMGGGEERHTMSLDTKSATLDLTAASCVDAVVIDPDRHLFLWRPEYNVAP